MKILKNSLWVCVVILWITPLAADTVKLTDGRSVTGRVVERSEQEVKLDVGVGTAITYYADEIAEVILSETPATIVDAEAVVREPGTSPATPDAFEEIVDGLKLEQEERNILAVYDGLRTAVKRNEFDRILFHLAAAKRQGIEAVSESERAMFVMMLSTVIPPAYQVVKSELGPGGNRAVLYLHGSMLNPVTRKRDMAKGKITFIREGADWKVQEESWTAEKTIDRVPENDEGQGESGGE